MRIGNRSDRRALEKLISAAPMESKARMAMGALKVGVRVLVASNAPLISSSLVPLRQRSEAGPA
jgi:hypothetical protein